MVIHGIGPLDPDDAASQREVWRNSASFACPRAPGTSLWHDWS